MAQYTNAAHTNANNLATFVDTSDQVAQFSFENPQNAFMMNRTAKPLAFAITPTPDDIFTGDKFTLAVDLTSSSVHSSRSPALLPFPEACAASGSNHATRTVQFELKELPTSLNLLGESCQMQAGHQPSRRTREHELLESKNIHFVTPIISSNISGWKSFRGLCSLHNVTQISELQCPTTCNQRRSRSCVAPPMCRTHSATG